MLNIHVQSCRYMYTVNVVYISVITPRHRQIMCSPQIETNYNKKTSLQWNDKSDHSLCASVAKV